MTTWESGEYTPFHKYLQLFEAKKDTASTISFHASCEDKTVCIHTDGAADADRCYRALKQLDEAKSWIVGLDRADIVSAFFNTPANLLYKEWSLESDEFVSGLETLFSEMCHKDVGIWVWITGDISIHDLQEAADRIPFGNEMNVLWQGVYEKPLDGVDNRRIHALIQKKK